MLYRNEDAVECLSAAREIIERNGYDAVKANLAGTIATALARIDRAPEAIRLVEECLQSRMHLRTGQVETCQLYAGYAEALVGVGDTANGLAALDHAVSIGRTIRNPWVTVECLCLRARLLAETSPGD